MISMGSFCCSTGAGKKHLIKRAYDLRNLSVLPTMTPFRIIDDLYRHTGRSPFGSKTHTNCTPMFLTPTV